MKNYTNKIMHLEYLAYNKICIVLTATLDCMVTVKIQLGIKQYLISKRFF